MGTPALLVYDSLLQCSYDLSGIQAAGAFILTPRTPTGRDPCLNAGLSTVHATPFKTTHSYYNSGQKFYRFCGLEATVLETDDNYRQRFVACPRENENACPLNVIDPNYPKQVRDVIDELAADLREGPAYDAHTWSAMGMVGERAPTSEYQSKRPPL
ncbi:hypothetical protein Cgig2_032203 [Carnegiea gigantea]|uniref:Uncharacterized protein n=1 Tax=Carnegiea gigantea TaxID=171969 RepID=A0A9Q1K4T3_9CARY|nr:hypothetical protein Cgig2_032203 [Carnegiea gigantea]